MIRLVEGDAATRAPLEARLAPSLGVPGSLITSRLTRLECRSKPLRAGDLATLAQFDVFFAGVELVLAEVSSAVVEQATDLRARYNVSGMAIHHRIGTVGVGETSVVIAVSAPHRADALAACRDAIDELKERVPLWKKEVYEGGEEWIGRGS